MTEATSPASSGPGGAHFEGQVGAFFLLSLLVRAECRGLPGTTIDKVEFQRASEGHPLDDVIVHAHDEQGKPALLEVQVKKGVTFSPTDPVFRSVIQQIAEVSQKPEFLNSRYELGIAISRTSQKIDGAYQDVLTWARQLGDATTFINRISRAGSANDTMRAFVTTLRAHLKQSGVAHDDEIVWQILRRTQILVFDFTSTGSVSVELAKERAVRALHVDDASDAGKLWNVLTELAIESASSGGDRTRERLIEDLQNKSFRLAGDRSNFSARAALAEASRNALADIGDHVAGAMLTRHEWVAAVRRGLDSGRYVEIRGDAGVGKSGVLKHFAKQVATEAQVIVLSPSRTIPKGWLAMRAALGFDGSAHDLLSDLAGGGGILFLDNLDFYDKEERLTVIDLLREAAKTPGMLVIATARRNFGIAEPSWLPEAALNELGQAEPVIIDELTETEIEELRDAAPQLRALLAETHPARAVARNLFRLSRLANRPSHATVPRTEVEMAEQWWHSADGENDQNHRDRGRLLRALAEQALSGGEYLDVHDFPAVAINALAQSETLRDLGNDHVTFRHDVLREWAVANLLFVDRSLIGRLPLAQLAPTDLARGVELAARMMIEGAPDSAGWKSFLDGLSSKEYHGSWRRAALLALVHSEIGVDLLNRASGFLFDKNAEGLRELIRLVTAIDVQPGRKLFSDVGIDPKLIPASFNVPDGPSWGRLILWLLSLDNSIPAAALPEVVDLYTTWSLSMLGQDPFTPRLVEWLYRWLTEVEASHDGVVVPNRPRPFHGELPHNGIGALQENLRTGFLIFCNKRPHLAAEYLQSLRTTKHGERVARAILKFRGALALAAPKELAELTAELLIPNDEDAYREDDPLRGAFGHHDLDFIPASPAQGPFWELLVHSREHGLWLVRKLVDHAISFKSGGHDFGANAIKITYIDGSERAFPWFQSYGWSRDLGAGPTIVASALMALEAWAHGRIEAGESFETVLSAVIGPATSSAAYLLVAVDLLLSHWPVSRISAIPFLACPELLCLDRQRMVADNLEMPDLFGLKPLQKEPIGLASVDGLKRRPSRQMMLDQLLAQYAMDESNRGPLVELLQRAASRLGPPQKNSTLGDPEFMVVHALNLIDPNNWKKASIQTEDGAIDGWKYESPTTEGEHLKTLQDAASVRHADSAMETMIRAALNDRNQSSSDFAAAAMRWAQNVTSISDDDEYGSKQRMRQEVIATAAMIAARDGSPELIAAQSSWIRDTFLTALRGENDPVHRMRAGLQFNPIGIAFVGMTLLLKNRFDTSDVRIILETAGSGNPAAAHGFASSLLAEIDERLPRAVMRCAFASAIRPHQDWRRPEEEFALRIRHHQQEVAAAIDAELAWLNGEQNEPDWPQFAPERPQPRNRFRSSKGQLEKLAEEIPDPNVYTDNQAAALWLGNLSPVFDITKRPWLRDIVNSYSAWTWVANGSELDKGENINHAPREWNESFFKLLAHCLPGLSAAEIDKIAIKPLLALPDESLFDVTTLFLRNIDIIYFDQRALEGTLAAHIRSALAGRIMATRIWEYHVRERSKSVGTHLGPAIAAVLFNDYGYFQPSKSYLYPKAIEQLEPFLPTVKEVAEKGSFLFVAIIFLNLLEVAPRAEHLALIVSAGSSWLTAYPNDNDFWNEHRIGQRLCAILESLLALDASMFGQDQPTRKVIDNILVTLIGLGVPEAHRLEESIRLRT